MDDQRTSAANLKGHPDNFENESKPRLNVKTQTTNSGGTCQIFTLRLINLAVFITLLGATLTPDLLLDQTYIKINKRHAFQQENDRAFNLSQMDVEINVDIQWVEDIHRDYYNYLINPDITSQYKSKKEELEKSGTGREIKDGLYDYF
jgi:hypothetical protein